MRRVYLICLLAQYALWALYLCSLVILYILGFFVDTVSLRWLLIPETEVVLFVSIALSLVVVATFVFQKIPGKSNENANEVALPWALPSMAITAGVLIYLVESLLKG